MMNNRPILIAGMIVLIIISGCLSSQRYEPKVASFSDSLSVQKSDLSQEKGTNSNTLDRKIISTAHIQIEVDSVQKIFRDITNITVEHDGFISSSSVYDTGGRKNGQVTVRVPQKNFYSAVQQIESLGTVRSKQISGRDVTEEFIDLGARLDNLKKQEIRLLEILKMANTVKDVLEVEHELERVRGEIERLTGRLNYLNQSIEMSTITVNAQEPPPITGESWGILDAIREAARGFVESIKGIIIFTGYIIPILVYIVLIIAAALGIKRKLLPRLRA